MKIDLPCDSCLNIGARIWCLHSGRYLCEDCYSVPSIKLFSFYIGVDPGDRRGNGEVVGLQSRGMKDDNFV